MQLPAIRAQLQHDLRQREAGKFLCRLRGAIPDDAACGIVRHPRGYVAVRRELDRVRQRELRRAVDPQQPQVSAGQHDVCPGLDASTTPRNTPQASTVSVRAALERLYSR